MSSNLSMQTVELDLATAEQTEKLAAQIATTVSAPFFIALQGDLGTGKTTFTRGFLHALGHAGKVKSPTYTILETYSLAQYSVNHFDLYRLADPEELELIGAHEVFSGQNVNLVEWPEQGEGWLPDMDMWINFEYKNEGRHVTVQALSQQAQTTLKSIQ